MYRGGTNELKQLLGKRVKSRANQDQALYNPEGVSQQLKSIAIGQEGFVAHPVGVYALVAFPNLGQPPASIEKLVMGGQFFVVAVVWEDFQKYFDIEVSDDKNTRAGFRRS